jgi:hypothetical protein
MSYPVCVSVITDPHLHPAHPSGSTVDEYVHPSMSHSQALKANHSLTGTSIQESYTRGECVTYEYTTYEPVPVTTYPYFYPAYPSRSTVEEYVHSSISHSQALRANHRLTGTSIQESYTRGECVPYEYTTYEPVPVTAYSYFYPVHPSWSTVEG